LEIWRTFDSGFRYDILRSCGGVCCLMLKSIIKGGTLICYSVGGHMSGINTLVDDVIGSGTVLMFEIGVMVEYNALRVTADVIELRFEGRGFSQLFLIFEDMV
jgi:hypothetical protein